MYRIVPGLTVRLLGTIQSFPFPSEIPGLTVRLLGLPPRRLLDNRRPAPSRTCGYSSIRFGTKLVIQDGSCSERDPVAGS